MKKNSALDCIGYVDADLIEKSENCAAVKKRHSWVRWGAMAACLCLVAGAVMVFFQPKNTTMTGDPIIEAGGVNGAGTEMAGNYSVAIFPAERTTEDVKNAYTEKIYEAEAQNEQGFGEYLPTELPNGYHFGNAIIYVTTMNDGTVYKMLRVTYRTGEEPEPVTDADGAQAVSDPNDLGDEFRLSVWGFKPDTSANIYDPEELNEATLSNRDGGIFYVQFENVYIGIEPLSLGADEIIGLVNSMKR